ncbi:FGGY-family carbohydrate kinase [Roseobacter sinensis]|uniref:FGGY-family carbohydrate kinase n=1 Tax=Roseobacter sinensis TaxID=2931391 RepID=A0ABT3BIF7_9RHOB|nr:FGGY-family carbohydrate kinase [Roseobacter sp. WL0113]MCV3273360.1 FGGY-family carbohydrate kinase [Roseobacter sp. WL0113]
MTPGHVAVIDIGKTNAKLALVDTSDLSEIAVVTRPNTVLAGPPYPHFDVETIWAFLLDALAQFHKKYGIEAISVTTHGAAGALIAADGRLAAPILDYEHPGPDDLVDAYAKLRPAFAETGSPRLPMGLNLGAQIHWQFSQDPTLRGRTRSIVTYPQYWGHRLTGGLASDVTSLGCHTDLWNPFETHFSSLVDRMDIADKMAPARHSAEVLSPLLGEVAARTGLDPGTPVYCGIHDSNASLLPHVIRRDPPFSVVSTGTWVIAMTIGGADVALDASRDTLVNVNALGAPVPSARFMGGREFEIVGRGQAVACSAAGLASVAERGPLLMPAVVPDSGPFQGRQHRWIGSEPEPGTAERTAALSFYLAMMTAECLSLTGHEGPIVVEGPFAANAGYCGMLSVATKCRVLTAGSATGTSQGAAMLALGSTEIPKVEDTSGFAPEDGGIYTRYAETWRQAVCGS